MHVASLATSNAANLFWFIFKVHIAGMRNSGRRTDLVAVGALSWGFLGQGVVISTSVVWCFNRFGVNSATEGVDLSIAEVAAASVFGSLVSTGCQDILPTTNCHHSAQVL